MGENRKENRQVKFRVDDHEFQKLEQLAKEAGMSVPSFVKEKAQGLRVRPPKIDREGALEIARELRKIGNNVNQIAKKSNTGGTIESDEIKAVEKELHNLWQQLNSAIQK